MTSATFGKRLGCYNCFKVLDPGDSTPKLQDFVCCNMCGAIYHQACWVNEPECFRCRTSDVKPYIVPPPLPLTVVLNQRPKPIKPSAIYQVDREGAIVKISQGQQRGNLVFQLSEWLTAFLGACFVMTMGMIIGAYSIRIVSVIERGVFTIPQILETFLNRPVPNSFLILHAGAASVVFGLFLLRPRFSGITRIPQTSFQHKLLGALLLLLCVDIIFLNISLSQFPTFLHNPETIWPYIIPQVGAIISIILLAPFYHRLAPILPNTTDLISLRQHDIVVLTWYVLVVSGLLWLSIWTSDILAQNATQSLITNVTNNYLELNYPPLLICSVAVALFTGLFLYRLPKRLHSNFVISVVRRLLLLFCLLTIAYIYTLVPNFDVLITLCLVVGFITLLLTPLYHLLFLKWADYPQAIVSSAREQAYFQPDAKPSGGASQKGG